jgi:hypothetical protein
MITAHIYGDSDRSEKFPIHDLCCKPSVGEEIFLENDGTAGLDREKFPIGWYRVVSVAHYAERPKSNKAPSLEIVVEPV